MEPEAEELAAVIPEAGAAQAVFLVGLLVETREAPAGLLLEVAVHQGQALEAVQVLEEVQEREVVLEPEQPETQPAMVRRVEPLGQGAALWL